MTFLAIIVAVLLLQAWGNADRLHLDGWFDNWCQRLSAWGLPSLLGLALLILLPTALALLVLDVLEPILFGVFWLLAAIVLLLYAFGRGDLKAKMGQYRSYAYAGDFEAAYLAFGGDKQAASETSEITEPSEPLKPSDVHSSIHESFLYDGLQRWFSVLFYFALLGPAWALAYRLMQLSRGRFDGDLVERCLFVLDWVPARLLAATFAIAGNFVGSKAVLISALKEGGTEAGPLLVSVGSAALEPQKLPLDDDPLAFGPEAASEDREFEALLARSAVCWIVVIALIVLLD
ncbi:MAG: regulatory signaling modulator protein AmpE [Pseudomonadota bacterium]